MPEEGEFDVEEGFADPDVPDSGPVLDSGLENTDVCNGVEVLPVGFLPILV